MLAESRSIRGGDEACDVPVRNEWRVVLAMKHDDTGNMAASSTRERAREVVI